MAHFLLEDLRHYRLGQGEPEALTLTASIGDSVVRVTDDLPVLIVADHLSLLCQLFLDVVVGRDERGELTAAEAQQIVQAVSPRYPTGFIPHSLAASRRLQP